MSGSRSSCSQRYLGKISDAEATRWIENLYGKSDVGEINVSDLPAAFNAG
jgi:hypothetical protein